MIINNKKFDSTWLTNEKMSRLYHNFIMRSNGKCKAGPKIWWPRVVPAAVGFLEVCSFTQSDLLLNSYAWRPLGSVPDWTWVRSVPRQSRLSHMQVALSTFMLCFQSYRNRVALTNQNLSTTSPTLSTGKNQPIPSSLRTLFELLTLSHIFIVAKLCFRSQSFYPYSF